MSSLNGLINNDEREIIDSTIFSTVKYYTDKEPPSLTAREFCRRMYGLSSLPEIEILRVEMHSEYRKRCIGLLSKALGVQRQSVSNWGGGLDFRKMPAIHYRSLGMYWELYELRREIRRLRRFGA
ncbi:MAG: hypothetical protein N5P05_004487 (plasmid) [Chroococcopsis gigantea SAG 12.99]|jgi:hypothetical protein|nr:hypothetical protein [Chroococcopsis gigantea SAG 12.99]